MNNPSNEEQLQSITAFQSTIRKCENALAKMTQQGSSTTLLNKRLKALQIGLSMLEHQQPHSFSGQEIAEARNVLTGLFPSLEKSYNNSKPGSPQRTLLERRIKAIKQAVEAME
ncbi:hypothetical protein FIU87_03195 [Bacillus sp. THAF10]|uniref:hypothetical protein n=1 Tax=Bacillus sp. THAF10 TaxID=2587848 RepID=UPI0012690EDA|nr:hypothetical protein [Bacillus sp. THAF10]QFT87647.1 hypothetical protein FIU87_03195 [Bacillus sp. THAF10]